MARPLSGTLLTDVQADGSAIFRAKFRQEVRTLPAGWTEPQAQAFLNSVLLPAAMLKQDWGALIPGMAPKTEQTAGLAFMDACKEYVDGGRARLTNPRTLNATETPILKHLLPFFAYADTARTRERLMVEVTGAEVQKFTAAKLAERAILRDLSDVLADLDASTLSDPDLVREQLDPKEWDLLYRYGQRGGRRALSDLDATGRVSLSSRGLTNNEINRCLTRLRAIVTDIGNERYGLEMRDPTRGRFLPRDAPDRDWLHPNQLQAALDAAREIDQGVHYISADPGRTRESALLMLALCGPRVSEFCNMDWAHLYGHGLDIGKTKTAAGERSLEIPTIVGKVLEERREHVGGDGPIWPTRSGKRRDRANVRNRLLAPIIARAAELLTERGHRAMPARVTPHTLRRTAMTYWAAAGFNQTWAMGQAGHASAEMTLEAYQQTFPNDPAQRAMVKGWLAGLSVSDER